jgi:hypothetical protein
MAISRDRGEWGDVPREHHLSIGSSFDGYHLCAATGRPNVSCYDGGGGRAACWRFGGYGFCNALHKRLAAVCGDLVRVSNRSHVYVWPTGWEARAALVAGRWQRSLSVERGGHACVTWSEKADGYYCRSVRVPTAAAIAPLICSAVGQRRS